MKLLFLALATLALTLNALGLELVKCGSIWLENTNGVPNSSFGIKLVRAKFNGTSLFMVSRYKYIVVIPHVTAFQINPNISESVRQTNLISDGLVDGVSEKVYTVRSLSRSIMADPNVAFATANSFGYINYKRVIENDEVISEHVVKGDQETVNVVAKIPARSFFWIEKLKHSEGVIEKVDVSQSGYLNSYINANWQEDSQTPKYNVQWKMLIPKLEDGVLNFYMVEDPDLFPDTALGALRVEGGSATFNVTTASEEPVEIQASDDLKIWKRLKTLEDANGRSVTVPADAAQGFLRAVER